MARPATDHDLVRNVLVEHGRAIVSDGGAAALVLTEVARRAGLSVPSLYHYFANRRALVLGILRAEIDELLALWRPEDVELQTQEELSEFLQTVAAYLESTSSHTVNFILRAILDGAGDDSIGAIVAPAFGRADSAFLGFARAADRPWTSDEAIPVADQLRACLAGLFLMKAVGAPVDAHQVFERLSSHL